LTGTASAELTTSLTRAADASRLALVPFVTAGFPDPATSLDLLVALADSGADAIELGVPFSDPLADGPTIQRTSQIALAGGTRLRGTLDILRGFRQVRPTPVVLMSYVNPILKYGLQSYAADAVTCGANGVIVTDVPADEMVELWTMLRSAGLATVQLVAPTTPEPRVGEIARAATGFVYCVSRTGVTGKGHAFAANLETQVRRVRAAATLPVLVGFGVRRPEDIAAVRPFADGVVVGAAVLEEVLAGIDSRDGVARAARFIESLRSALDRGRA
jgi:tryptophan synthase alpha chain